jgi:hypothetical protein
MTRAAIVLIAVVIVGMAVATGHGSAMMTSIERGLGWGIGREVAHHLVGGFVR